MSENIKVMNLQIYLIQARQLQMVNITSVLCPLSNKTDLESERSFM